MIKKKINKHSSILKRRIAGKKTFRKMQATGNPTLLSVTECLQQVIEDDFSPEDRESFRRAESYRKGLLDSTEVVDYSVFGLNQKSTVGKVCRQATSPAVWARLIFALVKHLSAAKVLEIGTNLGVSGSYILEAMRPVAAGQFITMEGMPLYVDIASRQFATIVPEERFEVILGKYEDTLGPMVANNEGFDLLFIDGNHQKEPTQQYFRELLSRSTRPSVWVFDDINWTEGMVEAWDNIKQDVAVAYSLDLYKLGIVIVDPSVKAAKHFSYHLSY
jgi:predicted O-methyltransferase YrrM